MTAIACKNCGADFERHVRNQCYCSPECRKAGLKAVKARWQREHRELCRARNKRHQDRLRHPCRDCGKLIGERSERCLECGLAVRKAQRDARRQRIFVLWNEGFTAEQVAGELDSSKEAIGCEINRMRRDGWDLPRRRPEGRAVVTTKQQSRDQFHNALLDGVIRRPARCEECGEPGHVDGHHSDYARPLYVYWLCRSCHMALHNAEKAAA